MSLFTVERKVLHYGPTADRFFNGYGGYQALVEITRFFGVKIRTRELDREDVPHWHYVQQRTLGSSEWRSRLLREATKDE